MYFWTKSFYYLQGLGIMRGDQMKKFIKTISAAAGLFVLMVVVMFIFRICPPQGRGPCRPGVRAAPSPG